MADAHHMNEMEKRRLTALYRASGIRYRHSVLPDFGLHEEYRLFQKSATHVPGTGARMELYRKEALPLSLSAIEDCLQQQADTRPEDITHLITVSCTGMYAPGLDIDILQAAGMHTHTQRSCINFMGCYAAFNALKAASQIIQSDESARVLIVCTELCTIHFQYEKTQDNFLSNALFADGSAAVLLSAQPLDSAHRPQLRLEGFYCDLAPEGRNEMGWQIGDFGFEMKLSGKVPDYIRDGIRQLTARLLDHVGIAETAQSTPADYYAVHPGGKRILGVIEEALQLDPSDNFAAYEVLKQYGNMSSATVLFVLHRLMDRFEPADRHKRILSFAFGPGLTLESMLLGIHFR
jgi:predicted naringenin-chalcone synthase